MPNQAVGDAQKSLRDFGWSNLVGQNFFEQMMVGGVGAVAGLIGLTIAGVDPHLLVRYPLTVACIVLAFVRIWKTIREEHETVDHWVAVMNGSTEVQRLVDRVAEIPYLLAITFLPLAAAAPLVFMVILALFYLADNYYNAELARAANGDKDATGNYFVGSLAGLARSIVLPMGHARNAMAAYFRARSLANTVIIAWLLGGATVTLGSRADSVSMDFAANLCFLIVLVITGYEVFVDPIRNRGIDFKPAEKSTFTQQAGTPTNVVPSLGQQSNAEEESKVAADKETVLESINQLSEKDREEVAAQLNLGPGSGKIRDRIWQWVVATFLAILLAVVATLIASFLIRNSLSGTEPLTAIFTAALGFIAGLFAPSPAQK